VKQLFSSNDSVSSKRAMAFTAFIAVLVLAFLKFDNTVILYFLSFIGGLMRLSTVDKFSNKNNAGQIK